MVMAASAREEALRSENGSELTLLMDSYEDWLPEVGSVDYARRCEAMRRSFGYYGPARRCWYWPSAVRDGHRVCKHHADMHHKVTFHDGKVSHATEFRPI